MEKELVCTLCGYAGEPNKKARGNGLVEFILWWFFLIPGIIYSIWSRGGNKKNVCPKCGSENMIPQDTPLGQKLMAEQPSIPQMSPEQLAMQKKNNRRNLLVVGTILFCIFILPLIIGALVIDRKSPAGNNSNVQPAVQENKPVVQSNLPTEPKARIEAIVKNLGSNYEVAIFGKNPNVKPIAPFEVIVNTDAGSCALAKQMNFDAMKALFTDPIAKKNIAKVRFNARRYISTSMGGDDARESTDNTWAESGPTNFFKVLTQMGTNDSNSKVMERQTWGREMEGCE